MSIKINGLGTNPITYHYNFDRNGGWAAYLHNLSLQNNHDRQMYNGELNSIAGMDNNLTFAYPDQNHGIPWRNVSGYPMDKSFIKVNNFTVKGKSERGKKRIERDIKQQWNPRYFGAHGV